MALVPITELLKEAEAGGYAVGAFNCNNMEIVQAIIAAAEAEKAPVIMQASQGAIKYAGLDYIVAMARTAAEKATVPVALHLDHGTSFEQVMKCIRAGFSSVMIDGSKLPLEENIALTKKVIDVAHAVGVSVEAELGKIGGTEDDISVDEKEALFTDPEEARIFVERTGVDALAVAIGTAHGQYKGVPRLDFERLKKIRSLVNVPIVLHGSSGVPDEAIQEAIRLGVRKVNIDTNIREAFVAAMREVLARDEKEIDPRKVLTPAREAAIEVIREKIRVFGSSGKA
ncbi:fructose-bisphosphate aldolase, class II [Carboxydocella sporoproducens DSM 16521]|uniref:Fructose-bisphosphate aldolase, class II n=2 Tax=Carboxydocella TaxID=178898 RepID=A0A1T4PK43_9FIRM|nr:MULTISPECIES: class II fructose-1,6-bisphosphate aldolase [Carboxydocella]AVX19516.1 fructose-bisphosphate aldolase, class II [Carboxydocella thermautotrophica]AVX29934.1 fructose-bisphosphate aldolase, class II [Carboxydocella thermautotrophica]SJZ91596.1 fructose-bisphosphate aldolase, class II [Carboxydocella sporoproducens DSM 16521]